MKTKITLAVVASLLATSCSDNHKRVQPQRHVKDSPAAAVTANPAAADVKALLKPLKPMLELEKDEPLKACARLDQLAKESREGREAFSYLGFLGLNGATPVGHVELKESPFTQLILGEKFKVDNFDDFFEKARIEYEAGRLSAVKWMMLKTIKATGIGKESALFSGTNGKLAEKFPGIFGESGPLTGSMHAGLAVRAAGVQLGVDPAKPETAQFLGHVGKILSAKMPLFPGDGSWQDFAGHSRATVAAAARGFREATGASPQDISERLCAHVLLHQSFSQLLRVKGLRAPEILDGEPGMPSRVEKLSSTNPEFKKIEIPGALIDLKAGKPIYVENEAIRKYDPARQSLLTLANAVPGQAKGPGSLGDSLAFMEAVLFTYEATSPAAEQASRRYLLGDIAAENSTAILPAEMHSLALALGLLTMQLKNMAGLHLREIKADGSLKKEGETAAGIALASRPVAPGTGGKVEVYLADAVRLARVALYLESSLLRLKMMDPAKVKALNEAYSPEVLSTLEDLRKRLAVLKFPAVLLMSQMATGKEGCFSSLEWDLDSGKRSPLGQCTRDDKLAAADVFELLGRDAKATLLLQKAEELRKQAQ